MALLELKNISKFFLEDNKEKYILKNINIRFPNHGLFTIEGKSGCGKSTLLNLISLVEKPSNGKIIFNGFNILKFKEKKKSFFRNKAIGLVFQNYNLLEDETAIYNVMIPLLLNGVKKKKALDKANKYFQLMNLSNEIKYKKCKDLSGGEKQRIGILRAIINEPSILLCDEPTGALDSKNSKIIMEIIKHISKKTLVIMVTHNHEIAIKYSDVRMIFKNNRLIYPEFSSQSTTVNYVSHKHLFNDNWSNEIVKNNLFKRKKRNLINLVSLTFSIWVSIYAYGFSHGANLSIEKETTRQFDKGNFLLYKSFPQSIDGSSLKLTKTVKLSQSDLDKISHLLDKFQIKNNISALFLENYIKINDIFKENINFIPIYNLNKNYAEYAGNNNIKIEDYKQVIVNKKFLELTKDNTSIKFHSSYIYNYPTMNELKPYISDYFNFDIELNIIDVIEEMDFLNAPAIYYSYEHMEKYLESIYLSNLSFSKGTNISWKEIFDIADANESINSYSHYLFLKDSNDFENIEKIIKEFPSPYKIDSTYLTKRNTLLDLIKVSGYGIDIFIYLCLLSSVLLLFIISFSNYSQDRKQTAILRSLGAKNEQIQEIYFIENFIVALLSLVLGLGLSILTFKPINYLLCKITTFNNLINFNKFAFLGKPYFLILFMFIFVILLVYFSSLIPSLLKKNKSIKKELNFE